MWKYFSKLSMGCQVGIVPHTRLLHLPLTDLCTLLCLPLDEFYTPQMFQVSNPFFSHWLNPHNFSASHMQTILVRAARLLSPTPYCCCLTPNSNYLRGRGRGRWSVNVLPPTLLRRQFGARLAESFDGEGTYGYANAYDGEAVNRMML